MLYVDGDRSTQVERSCGPETRLGRQGGPEPRPEPPDCGCGQRSSRAGNLSNATRAVVVRIRYIDVRPKTLHVKSGKRFSVRVQTDAKRYSWHLGPRGAVARRRVLTLRAGQPGTYRLVVAANGHVSRARVAVSP